VHGIGPERMPTVEARELYCSGPNRGDSALWDAGMRLQEGGQGSGRVTQGKTLSGESSERERKTCSEALGRCGM